MSLADFKNQLNKTSEFLSEKVERNKGSELGEDFVDLGRKLDVVNDCVEHMQGHTKAYLQPNPTARTKLALQASYVDKTGVNEQTKSVKYPQPEFNLAEVFIKGANGLNDNSQYMQCLDELGRGFNRLSEVKDSMEMNVAQNFLEPLNELQHKDLREINLHRKKLESRRLDYDYKKGKGSKVSEEELQTAEDKFNESKQLCYNSMMNFMDSDIEHIGQLHAFSEAIHEYHRQCAQVMEEVTNALSQKLAEAASRPRAERLTVSVHHGGGDNSSVHSYDNISNGSNQSGQPTPPPKMTGQQVPSARALYDFDPENEGELEFKEGDMITLKSRIDENWLEGTVNGKYGYFPDNYVEIVVPL